MIFNDVNTLEVGALVKNYRSGGLFKKGGREVQALKGVDLIFTPGLYGLLGPNGAGKSTLINIITGTINQSSGKVLYNNKTTRKLNTDYRRVLGYMPQQQTLYESFTGREFLAYMCALKEISSAIAPQEVDRVAALVNLTQQLDKRLLAYSGGMKQRLLAANALLGMPEILVLDEPTAGLDPKERVRLRNLMAEMAKTAIVILATHVVSDVESVADRIILLKSGEVVDNDSPEKLIERHAPGADLEQVYLNVFGED